MNTMTRDLKSTVGVSLLMAFELGQRWWKVGFTTGLGQRPRTRRIAAGALDVVLTEVARANARFGLPAATPVISCYEAGRDGFWLHRYLMAHGVTNHVVDSSSIEVDRRARRSKTDQLDLGGLLTLLARYQAGDRRCWRVVRVPSVEDEDARQLHRTRETLQGDRTRLINRLKATLAVLGLRLSVTRDFIERVDAAILPDGCPMPPGARQRLAHDWALLTGRRASARGAGCRAPRVTDRSDDADGPRGRAVTAAPRRRPRGRVGVGDGDLWVARDSKCAATRGVGRRRAGRVSKWRHASGSWHHARRESARAPPDGPTRVGLAPLAAEQRPEPVVSRPLCHGGTSPASHWHRRAGAEVTGGALAICGPRCAP